MKKQKQQGFTLIELLVTIAIMGTLAAILMVNYNQQNGPRNLKIAQGELTTNVRKIQSYILSSRNIVVGSVNAPPRYYILYATTNSSQYQIKGVNSASNSSIDLETIKLPTGIVISGINMLRAGEQPGNKVGIVSYVSVGYASPYGKMYAYSSDACAPDLVTASADPACLLTLADRQVIITLMDSKSLLTKTVTLYGVSGAVSASQ